MQSAFLMTSKNFTEKQLGVLFLVFGISQCIFIAPAGYFLDYSNSKIAWVIWSSVAISLLAVFTALFAMSDGQNMMLMIFFKFLQGAATSFLPSGFNAITLGIVGSTGFTHQVSRNKMMNHIGTALIIAISSLIAYGLYPNMGLLFITSPLFCLGLVYNIRKIKPTDVNLDAASSLIIMSPTMTEYETLDEEKEIRQMLTDAEENESGGVMFSETDSEIDFDGPDYSPPDVSDTNDNAYDKEKADEISMQGPGLFCGLPATGKEIYNDFKKRQAESPLAVLLDRNLMLFTLIFFLFHLANSAVLPLVMQSLSFEDMRQRILLSGLCIIIGQTFMMFFAKICGDYSPIWGRKGLFQAALFSLPLRCGILFLLLSIKPTVNTPTGIMILNGLMLSTQLLDAVGAGISGTLYIVITNDISGGTGRFSLMMGITSGAMCLGCTISGYLGQTLAEDYGYRVAIFFLGLISFFPAFMYSLFMPETLPEWAKSEPKKRRRRLISLFLEINRRRKAVFAKNARTLSARFRKNRQKDSNSSVTTDVTVHHQNGDKRNNDQQNYVESNYVPMV